MKPNLPLLFVGALLLCAACENQEENAYRTELGAILDKPFAAMLESMELQEKVIKETQSLPEDKQMDYFMTKMAPQWEKQGKAFIKAHDDLHALGAPHSFGAEHGVVVTEIGKLAALYKGEKEITKLQEVNLILRNLGDALTKIKVTTPALRALNKRASE